MEKDIRKRKKRISEVETRISELEEKLGQINQKMMASAEAAHELLNEMNQINKSLEENMKSWEKQSEELDLMLKKNS